MPGATIVPVKGGGIVEPIAFVPEFYRVRDFCRLFSLPASTAYRMIASGQVKAIRLAVSMSNPTGIVRIPRSEVDRLLRELDA